MSHSTETQQKVQAMRALIRAGYSNSEIIEEMMEEHEITPAMICRQRKTLKIPAPKEEKKALQNGKCRGWSGRCPKCGGIPLRGGVRFGMSVDDMASCVNCGLSTESESWYDAKAGERVGNDTSV